MHFPGRNIQQQHDPLDRTVLEMVIPDINVLGPVMKNWILREFDTTLIIAVDHGWIHPMTKQSH